MVRFIFFLLLTLLSTTLAGAEWITGNFWFNFGQKIRPLGLNDFFRGLTFSLPFIGVLTVHEFGHYYFARRHRADVSLPFYFPLWLGFLGLQSIGTMGAFIRIRSMLRSRTEYFDVGVAGPLAGFVAALVLLIYGFTHLPPLEYLFSIHPEYAAHGADYARHVYADPGSNLKLGSNLLFWFFGTCVAPDPALIPNGYELMHYPFLFAAYLSLFFTALNLFPIGQLDGGHILFSVFGQEVHNRVSPAIFVLFLLYAGMGSPMPVDFNYDAWLTEKLGQNLFLLAVLYVSVSRVFPDILSNFTLALGIFAVQYITRILFPAVDGNPGWMVFGLVLGRFLGIYHPPVADTRPLSTGRKWLAFLSLVVFILCFSPKPFG